MEAVGQLTGGVAHDFNNLLTVVLGNIDIMARKPEDDERRARRIDAVRQAAERGRDLTRQLLAFSRRQHLSPVSLDVNALIDDFAPLIRQAVGEAVTLDLLLGDEALCAHVDPTQLETALLNLAVNARDAMPEGGAADDRHAAATQRTTWSIEVARHRRRHVAGGARPGLRTLLHHQGGRQGLGPGPEPGLWLRAPVGRRGAAALDGRAGHHLHACACRSRKSRTPRAEPRGAGRRRSRAARERILVVEDDPTVLTLTLDMLSGLGYQVVTATNADEALEILQSDAPIDLLFSDVVMPGGVSGVSLARTARELRPACGSC